MPAGNFDEALNVERDGTVAAGGPLDASVQEVTELCVWVLQRASGDDAIANAMGMPGMGKLEVHDIGTAKARWEFPLTNRFKLVDFREGPAAASAFGVFVDDQDQQRAFFWSEPVRLTGVGAQPCCEHAAQAAHGEHEEHHEHDEH